MADVYVCVCFFFPGGAKLKPVDSIDRLYRLDCILPDTFLSLGQIPVELFYKVSLLLFGSGGDYAVLEHRLGVGAVATGRLFLRQKQQ